MFCPIHTLGDQLNGGGIYRSDNSFKTTGETKETPAATLKELGVARLICFEHFVENTFYNVAAACAISVRERIIEKVRVQTLMPCCSRTLLTALLTKLAGIRLQIRGNTATFSPVFDLVFISR